MTLILIEHLVGLKGLRPPGLIQLPLERHFFILAQLGAAPHSLEAVHDPHQLWRPLHDGNLKGVGWWLVATPFCNHIGMYLKQHYT